MIQSAKIGKVSMEFKSSSAVSLMSRLWSRKASDIFVFSEYANCGAPFSGALDSRDALEATGIITSYTCIAVIFSESRNTQILAAIVKGIVAFVVNMLTICGIHNKSRHIDADLLPITLDIGAGIERSRVGIPLCLPLPLGQPFEVCCINDGELTFSQRNKTAWLKGRLGIPFTRVHIGRPSKATNNSALSLSRFDIEANKLTTICTGEVVECYA